MSIKNNLEWNISPAIPDNLIQERWVEIDKYISRCKIHNTTFCLKEEPCWQCYNELDIICQKFYRTSGNCICKVCGKTYREHKGYKYIEWLKELCNGDYVKL
jgi:hypothetical protein